MNCFEDHGYSWVLGEGFGIQLGVGIQLGSRQKVLGDPSKAFYTMQGFSIKRITTDFFACGLLDFSIVYRMS